MQYLQSNPPDVLMIWMGNTEVITAVKNGGPMESPVMPPDEDTFEDLYKLFVNSIALNMNNAGNGTKYVLIFTIPKAESFAYTQYLRVKLEGDGIDIESMYSYNTQTGPTGSDPIYTIVMEPDAINYLRNGYGTYNKPLPEDVAIRYSELQTIDNRVTRYNERLAKIVATINSTYPNVRAALVDTSTLFYNVYRYGVGYGGLKVYGDYVTGGFYSLDGFYPTQLGHKMIANEVLNALANLTGQEMPKVSLY